MIFVLSGGGTKLFAAIGVTYPAGSTLTCTNGSKTLKAKTTTGQWVFAIPEAGTWTVSCTDGIESDSFAVTITTEGQFRSIELAYGLWLYNSGNVYTDITGGWVAAKQGDKAALELRETEMYINGPGNNRIGVRTANKIDVTEYSTLELVLNNSPTKNTGQEANVGLTLSTGYDQSYAASIELRAKDAGTPLILDITNISDEYYIGFESMNGCEIIVKYVVLRP